MVSLIQHGWGLTGQQFVKESLGALGRRGCKMVRLDAFGYATKKLGTRCFMEVSPCLIHEAWRSGLVMRTRPQKLG